MFRLLRRLSALIFAGSFLAAAQAQTPAAGSPAPDFALKDAHGKTQQLRDYRGKWVVLYFYPKNDTPGCTTQACSLRDGHAFLDSLGAQVLGVSIDDSASHRAFAEKYRLPFPLLADADGQVAARYGALSDWKVMKFAKRYTFLIDPQGIVRKVYTKVDPDTHTAALIADLRALTAARGS